MTFLTPIRSDEYAEFFATAVSAYAHDNVESGRWKLADAQALARSETERLLNLGASTPDHYIYTIQAQHGQPVGFIWYATMPRGSSMVAYVYQLIIEPGHRRLGHARAALLEAEKLAVGQGHDSMALNVFASNKAAQALYLSLGYGYTNHNMAKVIGGAGGV